MRARVVADIGNTRIKWGRCAPDGIDAQTAVPADDAVAWQRQAEAWGVHDAEWAVGSVAPQTCARFTEWLTEHGHRALVLDCYRKLPLRVAVHNPERVGLDRLFNAVAARGRVAAGETALIVDAGSAVTVDVTDSQGAFCGGAIFPGMRLMARALHEHTAQLPLVEVGAVIAPLGTSTWTAIKTGILHAVLGGIGLLLRELSKRYPNPHVFLTGGDGPLLSTGLDLPHTLWPEMTLEGIRAAAFADSESV